MNIHLYPVAMWAFLLVMALVFAVLAFPKQTGTFLAAIVNLIVGKPRVVAYTGRRYGVKSGAVSAQNTILAIEDGGTPGTYVTIGGMTEVVDPTGEAADLDATNLASVRKEYIPGLEDAQAVNLTGQRLVADAGQVILSAAVGTTKSFKQTLSNGEIQTFDAIVKKFGVTGGVDGILMFAASIRPTGALAYSGTGHTT